MPLKDLRGKTVYDLELEDFEKLFCQSCRYRQDCAPAMAQIDSCKVIVDCGLWDMFYRKN